MDPAMQRTLPASARRVCSSFAPMAKGIIAEHGLKEDEFDSLMKKMRRDFFFRWGMYRELKKITATN